MTAEVPTCQKMLEARAPPAKVTMHVVAHGESGSDLEDPDIACAARESEIRRCEGSGVEFI